MESILVCLPGSTYSAPWVANWSQMFVRIASRYRVAVIHGYVSNIYESRNACVSMVQPNETPDYLLWIDSDNIVTYEGFELLFAAIQRPEVGMVGAWYPLHHVNGNGQVLIAAGWGEGDNRPTLDQIGKATDLMEVDYIGLGFSIMKYKVIADLSPRPFRPMPRPAPLHFATDDVSFCQLVREAGFRVWLHPKVYSSHMKLMDLPVYG